MYLKSLEIAGFKSFAKKSTLEFNCPISAIVGPNGSGKSNVAEAFRFVLGEQSIKSLRGKRGEDLIFNGGKNLPRANRASVKVTFDNRKRMFSLDFDEVTLERIVHRDSVNEYLINGSQARLKDIHELLAQAHIGATGHHIISQGEADKILNASIKERRDMLEEALGLKVYQYKKEESERKLGKTEENIASVESLLREIAPHLRFLKKQVEKIEKAAELREDLKHQYIEYFSREDAYLKSLIKKIAIEKSGPEAELKTLDVELSRLKQIVEESSAKDSKPSEVVELERALTLARQEKEQLNRQAGNVDGEISFTEKRMRRINDDMATMNNVAVPFGEVESLGVQIEKELALISRTTEPNIITIAVEKIRGAIKEFLSKHRQGGGNTAELSSLTDELSRLGTEKRDIKIKIDEAAVKEQALLEEYDVIRASIEQKKDESLQAEKDMLAVMSREQSVRSVLNSIKIEEGQLAIEKENFERDVAEAGMMLGREVLDFAVTRETSNEVEERGLQLERRRNIEKIKIRLEESGVAGSGEVLKEYKEAEERDQFLRKELGDLDVSKTQLISLIAELTEKLDVEFRQGVERINVSFGEFFALMFGGGKAGLELIREKKRRRAADDDESLDLLENAGMPEQDEEGQEGIDIKVELPHKRTKGLVMLSGGERALTSIALLFAISQVNPPPFVILDETDAALDEANSRKYGDMIESLSHYSELILITHNRETMSRASTIYGVTMGAEGFSKLLSIQFEEAVKVAK
jgi:chromosome segregation protein